MKLATIILALIVGGSTVAVAQPQRPYNGRDNYGDRYRDRNVAQQWVTLSTSVPNNEQRHIINVYAGAGRFDKVRLSIDSGRVLVRQIAIDFADNTHQKVRVDRVMRAGQITEVNLPGQSRAVNRVIVYTEPFSGFRGAPFGTFSVLASRTTIRPQWGFNRDWMDRYDYDHHDRH
jgi:hypothetical protein